MYEKGSADSINIPNWKNIDDDSCLPFLVLSYASCSIFPPVPIGRRRQVVVGLLLFIPLQAGGLVGVASVCVVAVGAVVLMSLGRLRLPQALLYVAGVQLEKSVMWRKGWPAVNF
jgi:hypothetical protein